MSMRSSLLVCWTVLFSGDPVNRSIPNNFNHVHISSQKGDVLRFGQLDRQFDQSLSFELVKFAWRELQEIPFGFQQSLAD